MESLRNVIYEQISRMKVAVIVNILVSSFFPINFNIKINSRLFGVEKRVWGEMTQL